MNKTEFIKNLSLICDLSQSKCQEIMQEAYNLICQNLKEGKQVSFKGFGKFYVKTKKERFVKNFNSNNMHLIGCRHVPTFKMGKSFKKVIN